MFARNQLVQDGIIVENKGAARRKAHFSVIKNPATIAIKARYMQPPAAAAAASSTSEHREEQIMLSGEVAPTHEGSIVLSSPVQHSAIVMETSPMTLAAAQEARRSVRFSDALTVVPSSMQLTSEECGSHGEADFTQATQVLPESEGMSISAWRVQRRRTLITLIHFLRLCQQALWICGRERA